MPAHATDNFAAAKLEAMLATIMDAAGGTDEELDAARHQAVSIARLREDDLAGEPDSEPDSGPAGSVVRHLRTGWADRYEAPRVPAGQKVSGQSGGQWIQVQALAEFYAGLFNDMVEAGSPPEEQQVDDACADLEPYGWTLEEEDDEWSAVELEGDEDDEEVGDETGEEGNSWHWHYKRVKRGTPGAIERTDKRGRSYWVDKLPDPKATSEEARKRREDRGPVDREKLQERLNAYRDKHKVLRSNERAARASVGLLHRHHGEQALHRVEELADAAERAYNAIPEGRAHEGLRNRLGKKLAILHRMAELAGTKFGSMRKGAGDGLEGKGKRGKSGRVLPEQPLGEGAPSAPDGGTTGDGAGTGADEGPGSVPGGAGLGGDGTGGPAGGAGDAAGRGEGAGDGRPVPDGAAGAGALGEGGGEGSGDGSGGATPHERSLAEPPSVENPTDCAAGNWRYDDAAFAFGGAKTKFKNNIEAIKTLRNIEAEGRTAATPEEQAILSKFVGWGQFKNLFEYRYGDDWQKERELLRSVLSGDEYAQAESSTRSKPGSQDYASAAGSILNAHYTHPDVVKAHWEMAQRLGFKGGRFLETSAGIGYYLGMMPADVAGHTRATAVELDSLTGKMLKLLYPSANVNVTGFEKFQVPDNFYDLVASNVPFGDYRVHDSTSDGARYNKHKANIHDYFFLKSLDKVRPGGLVMHITSAGTMDKLDPRIRKELESKGELVSAIRFPGGAHKENAGTEVVTDMLIFRKKHPGEQAVDANVTPKEAEPEQPGFTGTTVDALGRLYHWVNGKRVPGPKWDDVVTIPDPAGGDPIPVNRYFAEHPEQVLGTHDRTGKMYHGESKNVTRGEDYEERLKACIGRLPEGLLGRSAPTNERFTPEAAPAPGDVKEGGYQVKGGKLYVREKGVMIPQDVNAKDLARIQGQLGVRDALRACLNKQLKGEDASAERKALNDAYDAFVAKHGFLNDRANKRAFRFDPDSPVLLALEKYDPATKAAEKADVFRKDTVRPAAKVEKADDVGQALSLSLHEFGRLDIDHMAKLLGTTPDEVGKLLSARGLAYFDPSAGWQPADQYLSGNVRRKLVMARAAAATDPKFQANVEALEKVQPEDIAYQDISVKMGTHWVPASDHAAFAAALLGGSPEDFAIHYIPESAEWVADFARTSNAKWISQNQQAKTVWAVHDKKFMDIFDAAMNNTRLVVWQKDEKGKTIRDANDKPILDSKKTEDVMAKVKDMQDFFKEWVWEDDERRDRLHRHYNDNFNNIRNIAYNGSHLTFPGMNPAIQLRDYQKNFVWQVVTTGTGLAAHEVGTGKAQPLDAQILTPAGYVRMGDLSVGDAVIGVDGKPTMVEAIFPQGEKEVFRVVFSDGAVTECCDEHLWLTQTYHERNYAIAARKAGKSHWTCDKPKVRSLAEIRKTLIDSRLGGVKNHSIPMVRAVQFDAQPVPIDPYTLGVLLGDGCMTANCARITASREDGAFLVGQVAAALPGGMEVREQPSSSRRCPSFAIVRRKQSGFGADRKPNPVVHSLASMGLQGCKSHQKFVPECYKINTPEVRLAVLQGLLDTDGSISSRKERSVTFYTTSDRLADDVVFLTRSLGGVARRRLKKAPTYTHKGEIRTGRPCHVLCLSLPPDVQPFRLERKASLIVPRTKYQPTRYIVAVEPVGKKPCQCIRVSSPDHLYVTDDFVVTHNTFSMIASAMELRRMGLAKKPAIACLKANIEAITNDTLKLYPGAKILSTVDMFDAKKRKETIARIATGDYDLVLLTHDHLDLLQMRPDVVKKFIGEELAEVEAAIEASNEGNTTKKKSGVASQLEKAKKRLEAALEDALDPTEKDDAVFFDELGIDQLFVDEAHNYKSLPCYTRQGRVKGVPQGRSEKATAMQMRARWLQEQNGGRGVVFATGTPVANTMGELFNMQRYLQPADMKERGVDKFDAWAQTFGETETRNEFTVTGEYKPVARFRNFVNLPELKALAAQIMDVRRADDLKNPDGTPAVVRPKRKDDVVVAPRTESMDALMADLQERAKRIKGKAEKGADNMLKICTEGRKGSIDMRLLDANAPDDPHSKANQMVQRVTATFRDNPGKSQLIFCDTGVNPMENGFHLYPDIINKLVAGGIPREKIADFSKLEGAKKEAAMESMRNGEILVGIGSTDKLGTGVNVQDHLLALHHLDVPWVPADVEQRDGRGWRHGNTNEGVGIVRYVSEGSLDQTFWQIIANKTKFIRQVIDRDYKDRAAREEDTEELSPEQLMAAASGDPRIMRKVDLDDEVRQLTRARDRHEREQTSFKDKIKAFERNLKRFEDSVEGLHKDVATLEANPEFTFTVGGKSFSDRKEAKESFDQWKKDNAEFISTGQGGYEYGYNYGPKKVGAYRGLDVLVDKSKFYLKGPGGDMHATGDSLQSIETIARNLEGNAKKREAEIQAGKADVERLRGLIGKSFAKADELARKSQEAKELDEELAKKDGKTAPAAAPAKAGKSSIPGDDLDRVYDVLKSGKVKEASAQLRELGEKHGLDEAELKRVASTVQEMYHSERRHEAESTATTRPTSSQAPRAPVAPNPPVEGMTPARKEAIHEALQQLHAANADGAREINGVGFNQYDSSFGKQLAEQSSLTDRQAEAAARMLGKYKRQLGEDLHKRVVTPEKGEKEPAVEAPVSSSQDPMTAHGEAGTGTVEEIKRRLNARGEVLNGLRGSAEAKGTENRMSLVERREQLIRDNRKDLQALELAERTERASPATPTQARPDVVEKAPASVAPAKASAKVGGVPAHEMTRDAYSDAMSERSGEYEDTDVGIRHPDGELTYDPSKLPGPSDDVRRMHRPLVAGDASGRKRLEAMTRVTDARTELSDQIQKAIESGRDGGGSLAPGSRAHAAMEKYLDAVRKFSGASSSAAEWAVPAEDAIRKHYDGVAKEFDSGRLVSDPHREAVRSALTAGKKVPPEVLKDYPDLAGKATQPPTPSPSVPASPPNVSTKSVSTSRGQRHVHGFEPSQEFWKARDAGKLPSNVTVRRNNSTGRWEASIWGADPDEVRQTAAKLQEIGAAKFSRSSFVIRAVSARDSRPVQYARLADRARLAGDMHSARIYARQARGEF